MSTETSPTAKHELEDAIARLLKGERDPVAAQKSRERMDRMREAIRQKHGVLDFAVPTIHELRNS